MVFKKEFEDNFTIISKPGTDPNFGLNYHKCQIVFLLCPGLVLHRFPPPHLAANTESLQRVETEPAGVSCLSEAGHELRVECPLQGRQTDQDHMLLLRGQLVLQYIVSSSGIKTSYGKCL